MEFNKIRYGKSILMFDEDKKEKQDKLKAFLERKGFKIFSEGDFDLKCKRKVRVPDSLTFEQICNMLDKKQWGFIWNWYDNKGYWFVRYEWFVNQEWIKSKKPKKARGGQTKTVRCVETGEVWDSAKELAEYLNINRSNLTHIINDKRMHKGKHYEYIQSR